MRTSIKNLRFFLAILVMAMCGYTVVAQSSSKNLSEVDPPLAVEHLDTQFQDLKIYSIQKELKISYEHPGMGTVKVQLFDVTGRELLYESQQKETDKFEFTHNVSTLPSSIYIVRIVQDNMKITRKLYI